VKVNWFSPLPPAKTEIAYHTARILPALSARADVTLWTDQVNWDRNLERHAPVRFFDPERISWLDVQRGGLSIYNIGNNEEFHGAIWEISRQHPGLVLLHDICLQHLFATIFLEKRRDTSSYLAVMGRYYGINGENEGADYRLGRLSTEYMGWSYPLTPLATENALGVVVHTKPALTSLSRETQCPLIYAPLPYPASPWEGTSKRSYLTRPRRASPYRLVLLGYIGLNRRLEQILQALAQFPDRDAFHFEIFGQLAIQDAVRACVKRLRLSHRVTLNGFVSEEKLDAALDAAHLAINLRYPTMGEASASQLRIWDHALPSLVTPTGWYAQLPEDAVAFVRPDHEVEDLQAHWRAFLADPDRFARMGECGRRHLEELHTPEAYTQTLIDFIRSPRCLHSRATAIHLAKRIGAEMGAWLNDVPPDALLRPFADQIRLLTR
jgi:glycosyltransferase involved in cell wall biosynthesis